jgi:hypothetical protein
MTECIFLQKILRIGDIHLLNKWIQFDCKCETCYNKMEEIIISQDIYEKYERHKIKTEISQEDIIMKVNINDTMKEKISNYMMKDKLLDILITHKYKKLKSKYWITHAINFIENKYN